MREERINTLSRWLIALVVIFIPLSILILISLAYGYNFPARQWTRFLLVASWMVMGLSMLAGLANMVNLSLNSEPCEGLQQASDEGDVLPGEEGEKNEEVKKSSNSGLDVYLAVFQSLFFGSGFILYIVFICIMVFPELQLQLSGI